MQTSRSRIESISPFFLVRDLKETIDFYRDRLGFGAEYVAPDPEPFFAILRRDAVSVFIKRLDGVDPTPNHRQHPWAPWDAYVFTPDPDALIQTMKLPEVQVKDNEDGLRGFEVEDPNGYILFFGCPLKSL